MQRILPILGVGLLFSALAGCAADNPSRKVQLPVPEDKAVALAQARIPGQPVQVRIEPMGKSYVYQIEIRDQDGTNRWVLIDGIDGSNVTRHSRPSPKN